MTGRRNLIGFCIVLAVLLSGCGASPKILSESPPSALPTRKMERVLIVVSSGVLDGLKTFDKQHVEHLASSLQTQLIREQITSSAIFPRVTDLIQGPPDDVMRTLRPTHTLRISPVRSFSTSAGPTRIEWLVQVQQAEQVGGKSAFRPIYSMTIMASLCITGRMLGIETQQACFDEIAAPILSSLRSRGL